MVFSDEDKVLIKNLYLIKGYGARKLISEFPEKNWKKGGLEKLLHSINELKQRLLHVWHGMDQSIIDSTVDEWRLRLRACVRAKGGHYEHLL